MNFFLDLPLLGTVQAWWVFLVGVVTTVGGFATKVLMDKRANDRLAFKEAVDAQAMKSLLSIASGIPEDDLTLDAVKTLLSSNKTALEEVVNFIQTTPKPYLLWLKKRRGPGDFVMMQVNHHFSQLFLNGPPSIYTGRRDKDLWPEEMANMFARHDEAAYISGTTQHVREPVYSPHTGVRGVFVGVKWSFQVDQTAYVCGMGQFEPEEET